MAKKLTPKQERFCQEYLVDLNATKAAERTGYSVKTAYSIGDELLRKPEIKDRINALKLKTARRIEINTDDVLLEIARLAFSDLTEIFEEDETLKPISEWPEDARRAVSSFEVTQVGDVAKIGKVKFWSKTDALEKLMKHLGEYERDNKQKGDVNVLFNDLPRDRQRDLIDRIRQIATGDDARGSAGITH